MKDVVHRLFRLSFVFALLLMLVVVPVGSGAGAGQSPSANAQDDPGAANKLPTDQIIIKYRDEALQGPFALQPAGQGTLERLSSAAGVSLAYEREMSGEGHVLRLEKRLPVDQVQEIADRLAALPEVEYAEPDAILYHTVLPNDPSYSSQWHYRAPTAGSYGINAPEAWDITTGLSSVVVAVVDTGITNHADLSGRTVPGYDFVHDSQVGNDGNGRDSNPADPGDWITAAENGSGYFQGCPITDSSWHGTHVAGTIGAKSNNGLGVAGINWNSKILPVRVLGKCGGYNSDIIDGVRWAAGLSVSGVPANANKAKVINLSLGGYGTCTTAWQSAIDAVYAAGTTLVVAAGNSNDNASYYQPASCDHVITVAANDRDGQRAFYSNYGSVVEVAAPGGETSPTTSNGVLSTLNTGTRGPVADTYTYYQGTSMAAPHVTGVVSLLYSLKPSITPSEVLNILQTTVTDFPSGSTCISYGCGSGIINAGSALRALNPMSLVAPIYIKVVSDLKVPYTGKVTVQGTPVSGQGVELRHYDGSSWSTYSSTTTNTSGDYSFTGVPEPGATEVYYVRWLNSANDASYLWGWYCEDVTSSGGNRTCNIDIADVTHVAPVNSAYINLPYAFQWNMRPIPSEGYFLSFYSYDGSDFYWEYDSPHLAHVNQWTITNLPGSMSISTLYYWEINVLGSNGYGTSYYVSGVYFNDTSSPPLKIPDEMNRLHEARIKDAVTGRNIK
jgi:serine protease